MTANGTIPHGGITDESVEHHVEELGFELVELRRRGHAQRPVMELRIDRLTEGGVTLDDCVRVSRALEEWMDGDPTCPERYVLEVSSPGVERRLTRKSHFERFSGRRVAVKVRAEAGNESRRMEGELLGIVSKGDEQFVRLRLVNGTELGFPRQDVADVRLVFNWGGRR